MGIGEICSRYLSGKIYEGRFNLETSVGSGKGMQDICVHGESEKFVVTQGVMRDFSGLPGTPRACVDFRDPTEVSRFKPAFQYAAYMRLIPVSHQSGATKCSACLVQETAS